MTAEPRTPPPARSVEPRDGAWDWFLPAPPAPPGAPGPPSPAQPGPVVFAQARWDEARRGYEAFPAVPGERAVADVLRVPAPLTSEAEREIPALVHLAVEGRPRPDGPVPQEGGSLPPVWETARAFLGECADAGIADAHHVLDLLGDRAPHPAFLDHGAHRTLGLGRLVLTGAADPSGNPDAGETAAPAGAAPSRATDTDGPGGGPGPGRLTVLLPAAPAPLVLDTCRVLAELALVARLFSVAGKASAPSLNRVASGYGVLAARTGRHPPQVLRAGTAVLMVDHARRLAAAVGLNPATVALEMAVVQSLLEQGGTGPHDAVPAPGTDRRQRSVSP